MSLCALKRRDAFECNEPGIAADNPERKRKRERDGGRMWKKMKQPDTNTHAQKEEKIVIYS